MRLACLYVGATYQARRPGDQAARQSSTSDRNVFPNRRPATRTRNRALELKTVHWGGLSVIMAFPSLFSGNNERRRGDLTEIIRRRFTESTTGLCPKDGYG